MFAVAKLLETGLVNMSRVEVLWRPVLAQLLEVCHCIKYLQFTLSTTFHYCMMWCYEKKAFFGKIPMKKSCCMSRFFSFLFFCHGFCYSNGQRTKLLAVYLFSLFECHFFKYNRFIQDFTVF